MIPRIGTWFEVVDQGNRKEFKTDSILCGQSYIFNYCVAAGIAIDSQFSVVGYRIMPVSMISEMTGDWIGKEKLQKIGANSDYYNYCKNQMTV